MWCTISWPQVLGSPDCTEIAGGAQGSSDCRGRNKLAVPATKIAALRDSEGSGSMKASEAAAANQRLSESTQLISEAERPVIS